MGGAVVAVVGMIVGALSGMMSSSKSKNAQERARRYSAVSSYSSAVRAIQLEREDRHLAAEIATEQKGYLEDAQDLDSQLKASFENAELLKGGGPALSPMPVEKILIPVGLALLAKVFFTK